jgi:hypothetical protein
VIEEDIVSRATSEFVKLYDSLPFRESFFFARRARRTFSVLDRLGIVRKWACRASRFVSRDA